MPCVCYLLKDCLSRLTLLSLQARNSCQMAGTLGAPTASCNNECGACQPPVMPYMQAANLLRHLAAVALPAQLWADISFKAAALTIAADEAANTAADDAAVKVRHAQLLANAAEIQADPNARPQLPEVHRRPAAALGPPTAKLRFYIQHSLISKAMRTAAAAACAREALSGLQVHSASWPPHYLSPLLAQLCKGQSHICLPQQIAATSEATLFLAASKVRSVALELVQDKLQQQKLSRELQRWDSVTELECWGHGRHSRQLQDLAAQHVAVLGVLPGSV